MRGRRAAAWGPLGGTRGGAEGPLILIHTNNSPKPVPMRVSGEGCMDVQQALDLVGGRLSPLAFVILRRAADGST